MQAPKLSVQLDSGSTVELASLYQDQYLALVFLRHFGCIFCRYQVAQLRPAKDLNIAFVCMESPEEAAKFKAKHRSPHTFISDPEKKLYDAFGVKRGTTRQILSLKSLAMGAKATFSGSFQGRPTSDPMQLSASFVLDKQGAVTWSHYADDAGDIISAETLREKLTRLD